jgi:pimeloyl-ACP methyl ester carboxylesterase
MYFELHDKQVFAGTGGKPFDNTKPVVLFLSGSGLDHTFWGLQSRFFAFRNYAVLVPDFPGHSNSDGPPLISIAAMADWLNDVVEVLGADNISLVGHSQGCLVALEFAARYPRKVCSVSFIASGLATPVNPGLIEAAENNSQAAIAMMLSWGFGEAGHLHQGPIPGNSMVGGGWKIMARNAPDALAADLKACDAYKNGKIAAAAIDRPQQVILAGKDRMAPHKAGMQLVENLANPELHIIQKSGHMLPLEAPDECRLLLRDFIFANNPAVRL